MALGFPSAGLASRGWYVRSILALSGTLTAQTAVLAVPLSDLNSTIDVSPNLAAITSWNVDTIEHLKEITNWFRIGSSGREYNCSTLNLQSSTVSDTNPFVDARPDTLVAIYDHPANIFELRLDFSVVGFPLKSGTSRMGETISITNTTGSPLNIHFFEYMDLDLTNFADDDTVTQTTPSAGVQSDTWTTVNAGIINCDSFELATVPATFNKLNNTGPDNMVYPPGFNAPFGASNVSWTLQWDFVTGNPLRGAIPPGQTVVIQKLWELQSVIVPEPTSAAVLAACALAAGVGRRKRRSNLH